jgi:hypothetical protein
MKRVSGLDTTERRKDMGWLFRRNQTRDMLIEHLTGSYKHDDGNGETVTLAHKVVGNNLWAVREDRRDYGNERYIMLYLMENHGGDMRQNSWGYKDISEASGPYESDCPLSYLDMVPQVPEPFGAAFRERVRAYHSARNPKLTVHVDS